MATENHTHTHREVEEGTSRPECRHSAEDRDEEKEALVAQGAGLGAGLVEIDAVA